jgi:hypothetical protein
VLYLSFVNVGQIFYGFGWGSILLEAGFLSMFLGGRSVQTPMPVIWLLRWLEFRIMFGAGLIKLRGDACWRNLTCLDYHYETQPSLFDNSRAPAGKHTAWAYRHVPNGSREDMTNIIEAQTELRAGLPVQNTRPSRHVPGMA